jgi:hypothetical protein
MITLTMIKLSDFHCLSLTCYKLGKYTVQLVISLTGNKLNDIKTRYLSVSLSQLVSFSTKHWV